MLKTIPLVIIVSFLVSCSSTHVSNREVANSNLTGNPDYNPHVKNIKTQKLGFTASTILVSNFFHSINVPNLADPYKTREFDFALKNINCHFSTPTYFYELSGCSGDFKGKRITLNDQMSAIILGVLPDTVSGGDAAGSLFFGIDKIECDGRSRGSSCEITFTED